MSGIEPTQQSYVHRIVNERIRSITPQLGIVETVYPHADEGDDSNYEVDVRLIAGGEPPAAGDGNSEAGDDESEGEDAEESEGDESEETGGEGERESTTIGRVQTHYRVPVAVEMAGASRGLEQDDMVLVQYLQGDSDAPVVTQAFYDADPENRAPITNEGDWRRQIGDNALVEIITDEEGDRKLNIGRQGETDHDGIDMGLTLNLDTGGFCLFNDSRHGLFFDGQGNGILSWQSMAMPWGASGDVQFGEGGMATGEQESSSWSSDGETGTTQSQTLAGAASASGIEQAETLAATSEVARATGADASSSNRSPAPHPRLPNAWTQAPTNPAYIPQPVVETTVNLAAEGLREGEVIDGYLEEHLESGVRVLIPAGEYHWQGEGLSGNYENAALIGVGGAAEFIQPAGIDRQATVTVPGGGAGSFRMANLTVSGETGAIDGARIRVQVTDLASSAVLESVSLPDGGESNGGAIGLGVSPQHTGDLYIRNCTLQGWPGGGLHASAPGMAGGAGGPVMVEGGLYRENNVAGVRLGSSGSAARSVTVVQRPTTPAQEGARARGVWVTEDGESLTIEDCDLIQRVPGSAISVSSPTGLTSGEVTNTRIANAVESAPISVATGHSWSGDVHLTGSGNLTTAGGTFTTTTGEDADPASAIPRRVG